MMKSNYLYGFQQENGFLLKLIHEKRGIDAGEKDLKAKLDKLEKEYYMQKGASMHMEKLINDWKKQGIN